MLRGRYSVTKAPKSLIADLTERIAILTWRHAHDCLESAGQMGLVRKPRSDCDVGKRMLRTQHLTCLTDSRLCLLSVRRQPHRLLESA
jgi:hypothetical protein